MLSKTPPPPPGTVVIHIRDFESENIEANAEIHASRYIYQHILEQ